MKREILTRSNPVGIPSRRSRRKHGTVGFGRNCRWATESRSTGRRIVTDMRSWWAMSACGLIFAGCIGPQEMRLLTCNMRDLNVEARSYDSHDPFADESSGPETFSRPRTFVEPRSDSRKALNMRQLSAMYPNAGNTIFARGPQPLWRLPGSTVLVPQPGAMASSPVPWSTSPNVVPLR